MVLFLDHIKDVDHITIEGKKEDVELFMSDGSSIYSQCKSCKIDNWDKEYRRCFTDALRTLSKADERGCVGLIYATNIIRPLGRKAESGDFPNVDNLWIRYDELSEKSRTIADNLIKNSGYKIDVKKLSFRIIGFTGETERNKTRVVYDNIRNFIAGSRINNNVDINHIFSLWFDIVSFNASDEDTSKTISKKHIVWLFIQDQMEMGLPSLNVGDVSTETELKPTYGELIDQYAERVDFVSGVLSDYNEWAIDKPRGPSTIDDFVCSNWESYKEELYAPGLSDEYQQMLIQIILKKILNQREFIRKIKEATNL